MIYMPQNVKTLTDARQAVQTLSEYIEDEITRFEKQKLSEGWVNFTLTLTFDKDKAETLNFLLAPDVSAPPFMTGDENQPDRLVLLRTWLQELDDQSWITFTDRAYWFLMKPHFDIGGIDDNS